MAPEVKVFISYAREDSDTALQLFREIAAITGVKPWLDVECVPPGANWNYEITSNLEDSDIVLVLLSFSAVDKQGYIQKEISKILEPTAEDWRTIAGIIITRTWRPEGEAFIVSAGRNYIGSGWVHSLPGDPTCDIHIPVDPKLSSEHALIQVVDGNYEIFDLASENGTYVNGKILVPLLAKELLNYSEIHTGSTNWQFVKLMSPTW